MFNPIHLAMGAISEIREAFQHVCEVTEREFEKFREFCFRQDARIEALEAGIADLRRQIAESVKTTVQNVEGAGYDKTPTAFESLRPADFEFRPAVAPSFPHPAPLSAEAPGVVSVPSA